MSLTNVSKITPMPMPKYTEHFLILSIIIVASCHSIVIGGFKSVCVCEREREGEREGEINSTTSNCRTHAETYIYIYIYMLTHILKESFQTKLIYMDVLNYKIGCQKNY